MNEAYGSLSVFAFDVDEILAWIYGGSQIAWVVFALLYLTTFSWNKLLVSAESHAVPESHSRYRNQAEIGPAKAHLRINK